MQYKEDYPGLLRQIRPWAIHSEEEYQRLQKDLDELEELPWTDGRSMMIDFLKELISDWNNNE